jgi:hypothetical protein
VVASNGALHPFVVTETGAEGRCGGARRPGYPRDEGGRTMSPMPPHLRTLEQIERLRPRPRGGVLRQEGIEDVR